MLDDGVATKAFHMICQEVGGDNGIAIVAVLSETLKNGDADISIGPRGGMSTRSWILHVIKEAIHYRSNRPKAKPASIEPATLFCRLIDGADDDPVKPEEFQLRNIIPSFFFNGSLLRPDVTKRMLAFVLKSEGGFKFPVSRKWSEAVIKEWWFEVMDTWKVCAEWEVGQREDKQLSVGLISWNENII